MLGGNMAIEVPGVEWTETVKIIPKEKTLAIELMTKSDRFFRSTSFELTKEEAMLLAEELTEKSEKL